MNSRFTARAIVCIAMAFGFSFSLGSGHGESLQDPPAAELSERPVADGGGEIGKLLRKWYSDGTAAGNLGDYYDNRDGGHSNLDLAPYPQLQPIRYTEQQIKAHENWGLQKEILPHVVFGNSSTAAPLNQGGSNARQYYATTDGLNFLFSQYARNNLYIYPEHHDHDPGNYGNGGYGDLFPTNTPYLIASQGSSGSDKPFMQAIPYVLAAFRPEVKKRLVQSGLLMPTVQMILRITGRQLSKQEEYLTGKAHPSVFRGGDLNVRKMIEMAHEITPATIPPIALLKVLNEDAPANGIDYFEPGKTEALADTPAVIARIFRGSKQLRRMTVSAARSRDLNGRPLKYYWVVLRGDPDKIQIEYLNPYHSVAEVTVPYFRRAPIVEGSELESNRVDIGVFVHNGVYYSPPAFITFYTLDSEARTYASDGKPLEIAYDAETSAVSIANWAALFDALDPASESWPCRFLRRQFRPEEIAGLMRISKDFRRIHPTLNSARQKEEQASAADKAAIDAVKALETRKAAAEKSNQAESNEGIRAALVQLAKELAELRQARQKTAVDSREARKAVDQAQKSEREVLEKKVPDLNEGASALVRGVLNRILQDPNLWAADREELEILYGSAGREAREACDRIKKQLILFGVGEDTGSVLLRLKPVQGVSALPEPHLTRYERAMVENWNAVLLSRIVVPGIVESARQEHFVDFRIAAAKGWRDVYRYAADGTPMGWRRYQSDGVRDFNADGLLVLNEDSQGRCILAKEVRYELEPQKKDSQSGPAESVHRKVRMVPSETTRAYEYEGADDWSGHIQLP